MSSSLNWVQALRPWSMSTAAWGRVTRPCSSSLSVFLSRLHVLQTWCWLIPTSFCTTSSDQSLGLQEAWLQASALDWPTALLSPRKSFCSTDTNEDAPSAKDHERTRRGRAKEVRLTPNTLLPCREVILHNSKNKNMLNNILCSYPLPHNIQLVNMLDCVVTHDEADTTLRSYMLKAVAEGAQTIRILSDDTDVFVLLVYWIQMEKCLGHQRNCSAVRSQKVQSASRYPRCDTVSYPFGKGKKISAQFPREIYIYQVSIKFSVSLAQPTLSSRRQHTHSSYPSTDRKDVQQWMTHMPIPTVAIRNLRHGRNFPRMMPTCSCMCYELIFRCYCGRPRTNVIHLKKLETLPTLVGTSKASPSHRPSQQCQLLPKHYWM